MKFSEKELLYLTNASGEKLLTSIFDFDDTDEEFERCYDLKKNEISAIAEIVRNKLNKELILSERRKRIRYFNKVGVSFPPDLFE